MTRRPSAWATIALSLLVLGQSKATPESEARLRATIERLVACGTRHSLSSWSDPKRGAGCGRDAVVQELKGLAGIAPRLQIVVDRFEATAPRTHDKPAAMENVYAILPGSDAALKRRVLIVSGHFDSMPSDVMDPESDAPGADDDASGVALSLAAARALGAGTFRATLIFAAVSGEEQGLLGSKRMKEWLALQGYDVAAMITADIVGATNGSSDRRVRVFSAGGTDGIDPPSRELARRYEELAGELRARLIFRRDRFGRGGDHMPFLDAGMAAIRLTEPLEEYRHEHQTPRLENGARYGDLIENLDFPFLAEVAEGVTALLRDLADAPAPPRAVWLGGAVSPAARIAIEAESDPERAGFEILIRDTTAPRWKVLRTVDGTAEAVLDGIGTDNDYFAVRAVGRNGRRSIAVPAVAVARK